MSQAAPALSPIGRRAQNRRNLAPNKKFPWKKISPQQRRGPDMAEFEQQEIPFKERRLRSTKLRRGIFLLPSMFTVANLLCGYYAVVACFMGGSDQFDRAAKAIGFAILFDSLDGRVARMTGTTSEFGVQFDSLADVVSFGVAPALMAYAWGVRSLPGQGTLAIEQLSQLGWICCLAFLICCAWRLARFNVQGMAPGGSKSFVGLPTPAAAGVIAAFVHGFKTPLHSEGWAMAWLFLTAGLGRLMTCTIRYYSFKDVPWTRRQRSLTIVLVCLLFVIVLKYSEIVLVIFAAGYAAGGVILQLVRIIRQRMVSRTA